MNKVKLTRAGLELQDLNLRIGVPGLYQLSYLHWRSPYFVNIFVRGGGHQSEVMKPYILPF